MPCFITIGKFQVSYRKFSIRTPLNEPHPWLQSTVLLSFYQTHQQPSSGQRTCSSQNSRIASKIAGVGRRTTYSSTGVTNWNGYAWWARAVRIERLSSPSERNFSWVIPLLGFHISTSFFYGNIWIKWRGKIFLRGWSSKLTFVTPLTTAGFATSVRMRSWEPITDAKVWPGVSPQADSAPEIWGGCPTY